MVARVAYMILAHNAPEALHRLLWRINRDPGQDNRRAFVHIDKKVTGFDSLDFRAAFPDTMYLENRVSCVWGSFNICRATINLMRAAYENAPDATHFALLSGACYPTQPLRNLEAYLAANPDFEHITASPMEANSSWVKMLNERYVVGSNNPNKQTKLRHFIRSRLQRFSDRITRNLGETYRLGLLGGRILYKGSQWTILTRTATRHVLDTYDQDRELRRLFQSVRFSSEQYFHTIVCNSPLLANVRPSVTFTDWTQKGSSPTPINIGHALLVHRLLQKEPNRFFFMRKVVGRSTPLYDALDELPNAPLDINIERALNHWY